MIGKERFKLSGDVTAKVLLKIPLTKESLFASVFKYFISTLFVIFGSFEPTSPFSIRFSSKSINSPNFYHLKSS